MELALKMIALPQEKTKKQEESPLAEEIREVSRLLSCNEAWFRLETDEDLIEACIYESRALRARYRYLLRMSREQNVHISPF